MIQPLKPIITSADIKAVSAVLSSGNVSDGAIVRKLEEVIGQYHSCQCVCVSSGTVALQLAIMALQAIENKFYYTTSIPEVSHISTVHAAIMAEADKIITSKTPEIAVDLNGGKSTGGVIADSCQSILTTGIVDGRRAVAVSMGAIKNITCGIGGAVLSNNDDIIGYIRSVKSYGKALTAQSDIDISRVGTNARMSDINAALGLSQWSRRYQIIDDKWRVYNLYRLHLGSMIPERDSTSPPWVIQCHCGVDIAKSGMFRAWYPTYKAYPHLERYLDNWHIIPDEPVDSVMLPSWIGITDEEIREYSNMILSKVGK